MRFGIFTYFIFDWSIFTSYFHIFILRYDEIQMTAHFKLMQIDTTERKSVGKRIHAKEYRTVNIILTVL